MDNPSAHGDAKHEEFSLPLFAFTVLATLTGLLAILRYGFPSVWTLQFVAPAWTWLVVFLAVSLFNCIFEYFFHRYILHTPLIPIVSRLYKQHTLHHALTRIGKRPGQHGRSILFIENKFPIIEPEQGEASFFPWYSLAVFAAIISPILAVLETVLPQFPWFVGGFAALASSLALYEILHAINHWPFETWRPLIESSRWSWFWRPAYAFHLRHHAVIDCNESISGFFGLPVGDWLFRTCIIPKTVYEDGEEWSGEKFESPRPVALIRWLDARAKATVEARRLESSRPGSIEAPVRAYSRGEYVANWVTRFLGLGLSVAGLTLLIVFASLRGGAWHVVSFTVFGSTLLVLNLAWTLYHAWGSEKGKQLLRRLGNASVFLAIAGTCTPFYLTGTRSHLGWALFGTTWGVCVACAVGYFLLGHRMKSVSRLSFIVVTWLAVAALVPFLSGFPERGLWLLGAGLACYAGAVAFNRWQSLRYNSVLWHGLWVGGSVCHLLAVLLFLLPSTA